MRVTIIWLCILFVENVSSKTPNRQRFTVEPRNATALIGSRLTLPCRVKDRRGIVQWTKNDFGLGDKRDMPEYERYRMTGSDGSDEEDFSLEINPVTIKDEDKFQCQVGFGPEGHPGIQSQYSWVTVIVPPRPPKILQGNLVIAPEGSELPLECVSEGGKPAPQLDWVDDKGKPVLGTSKKKADGTGKTFTVRSVVRMKIDRSLHNTTITCRAKSEDVTSYRMTNVLFQVLFPPEVHVEKIPSEWITEGSDVTFLCRAKGNPSDFTFEWSVKEKVIAGATKSTLVFENVPRELNDVIVKCRVENAVGKSTGTEIMVVGYGPSFRSPPKSIAVEVGTVITLPCDAVGNPPPAVTWLHNNTVVGTSSNLTLLIHEDSGGIYTCKAFVPGFSEIQADHGILIKGRPIVVISGSLRGGVSGKVKLKCIAFSTPPSPRILWTFEGEAIDKNDQQDYFIREKVLPNGIESTLTFSRSKTNLYGTYNCSVRNAYGTGSDEKVVEVQDNFLIEIAGVVGGVVVVAAFVVSLCAFFRYKNHVKQNWSNSDVKNHTQKADSDSNKNKIEPPLPESENTTLPVPSETPRPKNPTSTTVLKDSGLYSIGYLDPITDNAHGAAKDSEYLVTNGLYDYNWSFQPDNYWNNDVCDRQLRNPFRYLTAGPPSCSVSFFKKEFSEFGRYPNVSPRYENTKFGTFFTVI